MLTWDILMAAVSEVYVHYKILVFHVCAKSIFTKL